MLWSCLSRSSFIHIYSMKFFLVMMTLLRQGLYFFNLCLQALYMFMRYDLKRHQSKCSYFTSFLFICIGTRSLGNTRLMMLIIGIGSLFSFGVLRVTNWYYTTDHDRKIQLSTASIASLYGLFFVLYLLINQAQSDYELTWRFYGLGRFSYYTTFVWIYGWQPRC